jgi:hypothetical protein
MFLYVCSILVLVGIFLLINGFVKMRSIQNQIRNNNLFDPLDGENFTNHENKIINKMARVTKQITIGSILIVIVQAVLLLKRYFLS